MFNYLILAVIIILLISLIYWLFFYNNDANRRKRSKKLIQNSSGIFDGYAREALAELNQITNPNPDDYFHRGQIIQYNIFENNIRNPASNHNNAIIKRMLRDYNNAIAGIRDRPKQDINSTFIIDHIENFNRVNNNLANEYGTTELEQLMLILDATVNNHAGVIRQEIIEDRKHEAVNTASTRGEAINRYFTNAQKYTDDRQNVHDSKVNSDLREVLFKFKNSSKDPISPIRSINEIREYIRGEYSHDPNNRSKIPSAEIILNTISAGDYIGTYSDREDNILAYVWERCKHPNNRENSTLMREAVVNALADGVENNIPVCINGRCSRVLNSLALLDYDPTVNGAMTFEAYKNQIYQETKEIINNEISRARNSADCEMRNAADMFDNANIDDDVEPTPAFIRLRNDIKTEIDNNVKKYTGKLNEQEINNILQDCYAYATI